ncbi:MAG: hypothetical protein MI745_15895 [Pseudomonadales bacterium]|nr:hypothetical protein [Pseudomonadales bacterium]
MVPVVLTSQVPWWASVLLLAALPLLLRGWSPPQPRRLELRDGVLTVIGRRVQVLDKPGRVLRLGPWLAIQTPKGWLHVFEDQAPRQELQPFYQWFWANRKSN